MSQKRNFIDTESLKKALNKSFILLAFVFVSHCAWAEKTPTAVLHYQGGINGTVQFDKVACYDINNNPQAFYVYAPNTPVSRGGRLFGPRFTLIAGRQLEFVPDQYHQRPLTTLTYDIPVHHPEIVWHKRDKNFVVVLNGVKTISYGDDGKRHITYLSGKINCNLDAQQSMQEWIKTAPQKPHP